jgi:hypothetical protein
MPSIFHYTDSAGLLGILASETLYATDYRYLNDRAESGIFRDLLLPILEAEIAQLTPKLVENGWLKQAFYEQHGAGGHATQAAAMYRSIMTARDNISPPFVLSFCRHDEKSPAFKDGLLSQWRTYAVSGGFAIEFDEHQLDALLKIEQEKYAHVFWKSDDVRYDNYEQAFDASTYKGLAGEMIRTIFDDGGIDTTAVTGHKNIDEIVPKILATAPFLKHYGFYEEQEYRVVAASLRDNKKPPEESRTVKTIKTRLRSDLIIPYIELFESTTLDSAMKSIIVGPHPDQDKQAHAVEMALETEEINIPIRLSAIPYRR